MQTIQPSPLSTYLFHQPSETSERNELAYQATRVQDVFTSISPAASASAQLQKVLPVVGENFIKTLSKLTIWEVFSFPKQEVLNETKLEQLKALVLEGDASAQYFLEIYQFINDTDDQRVKILRDAAMRGNSIAQFVLGFHYAKGKGVIKDPIAAASWCRKAADTLCEAKFNFGLCLLKGKGVPKNPEAAASWFEEAAQHNYPQAQHFLAKAQFAVGLHYYGEGEKQDQRLAFSWFEKAAQLGNAEAEYYLSRCYFRGEGTSIDQKLGAYWCKKAAMQKHATALLILGVCYANGEGVKPNREKAISYLEQAGKLGKTMAWELIRMLNGDQ